MAGRSQQHHQTMEKRKGKKVAPNKGAWCYGSGSVTRCRPSGRGLCTSRCRAPMANGHLACASGLCWEEHTGPYMAQGGKKNKGLSAPKGQHPKEARYNQGLGRACWHMAQEER